MVASHNQRNQKSRAVYRARGALFYAVALALCSLVIPQRVSAQLTTPAATTQIQNATNLKAQPLALLAKFPDAGPAMARYVAQQVTQQPGIADALLSIVNDTSPAQASAMGAGMVRAVRAIAAKQPATSRDIAQKVMRSDNKWLTTTFASLGPRYSVTAPENMPASLPPRALVAGDIGFSIGGAWRVGPARNENLTSLDAVDNKDGWDGKCPVESKDYVNNHCRGMIVALMTSDAPSNGAVSVSP